MKYGIPMPFAPRQSGPYHATASALLPSFTINMNISLIEVAKENPDLIVSLKLGELLEFAQTLAAEVSHATPAPQPQPKEEKYLTRNEVMEIFGVSSATLWRWSKGYLVPEKIGNGLRYKLSDIEKRLGESRYGR